MKNYMNKTVIFTAIFLMTAFTGCEFGMTDYFNDLTQPSTFMVRYDANGGSGMVPSDETEYVEGDVVTIQGNPGNLVMDGYYYAGWNTSPDASGTSLTEGETFTIGRSDVVLYARWSNNPVYRVTYDANGADSGIAPVDNNYYEEDDEVILTSQGTLLKSGYAFLGWSTAEESDIFYTQGIPYSMGSENIIFYAKWYSGQTVSITYVTVYDGGTATTIINQIMGGNHTVLPLTKVRTGYHFKEWNTEAAGTGTAYMPEIVITNVTGDLPLYAIWEANTGTKDTTFGDGDGIVTTEVNSDCGGSVKELLFQTDDKIILAGRTGTETGADPVDFALVRYTSAGIIDTTFGAGGIVIQNMGSFFDRCTSAAIQNNTIIAAGHIWTGSGNYFDFGAARYYSNGTIDNTFGINTTPANLTRVKVSVFEWDECNAVAVQDDDKVVLAGKSQKDGASRFTIVRLISDGALDTTFGTGGILHQAIGGGESISSIVIQPDKKIVAAGSAKIDGRQYIALARFDENGDLDTSFGSGGITTTPVGTTGNAVAKAVVLQGEKIIVAGWTNCNGNNDFVVIRYNPNGIPDNTFGTNGIVITDRGIKKGDALESVAFLPDGRIIGAGYSSNGTYNQFTIVCYTADGKLDTTFGGNGNGALNGFVIPFAEDSNAVAVSVKNGKIFAGGKKNISGNKYDFALTCIKP